MIYTTKKVESKLQHFLADSSEIQCYDMHLATWTTEQYLLKMPHIYVPPVDVGRLTKGWKSLFVKVGRLSTKLLIPVMGQGPDAIASLSPSSLFGQLLDVMFRSMSLGEILSCSEDQKCATSDKLEEITEHVSLTTFSYDMCPMFSTTNTNPIEKDAKHNGHEISRNCVVTCCTVLQLKTL